MSRTIDLITIHCSATPNGRWNTAADIDAWHKARGFRRDPEWVKRQNPSLGAIGYHFIILANGALATGRNPEEKGAHAIEQRANHRGLGVCLIGTDKFSPAQWDQLAAQVFFLCAQYGVKRRFAHKGNGWTGVCGHRDLGAKKTCPGFAVEDWIKGGLQPLPGHILEATP